MKDIEGIPVINAKRPINITITAGDIAKADRKEPDDCAVARACRRELHAQEVRVHLGRVYVRMGKGSWTRYLTPKTMRAEIIVFDRGGHFEPGEFTLPVPGPSHHTGKRQGTAVAIRRGKKRRSPHVVKNVRAGPAP